MFDRRRKKPPFLTTKKMFATIGKDDEPGRRGEAKRLNHGRKWAQSEERTQHEERILKI